MKYNIKNIIMFLPEILFFLGFYLFFYSWGSPVYLIMGTSSFLTILPKLTIKQYFQMFSGIIIFCIFILVYTYLLKPIYLDYLYVVGTIICLIYISIFTITYILYKTNKWSGFKNGVN
jgi:hypothetical protein